MEKNNSPPSLAGLGCVLKLPVAQPSPVFLGLTLFSEILHYPIPPDTHTSPQERSGMLSWCVQSVSQCQVGVHGLLNEYKGTPLSAKPINEKSNLYQRHQGVVISFTKRQTGEFFKISSSLGALEMRFNLGKKKFNWYTTFENAPLEKRRHSRDWVLMVIKKRKRT